MFNRLETVSPEGLRVRANMVRGKINDGGSCARHLELAADELARLTADLEQARRERDEKQQIIEGWWKASYNWGLQEQTLRAEIGKLKRLAYYAGVCELAADNPNVASYAKEWEARTGKAEAALAKAQGAKP